MHETSIQTLLVEDNLGDTILLRQMLANTPFGTAVLTCTERLQSAIELCRSQSFEIILLDLSLPDSQGYATFERLRQQAPQTPIILLTGFDDQELALFILTDPFFVVLIEGLQILKLDIVFKITVSLLNLLDQFRDVRFEVDQ